MENATKALLIAAAILVAILIISLGLVVYNIAAETVQNVDISATEIQAHNDQYKRYEGTAKRGSQVNAMLDTVLTNNLKETNAGKKVTVYWGGTTSTYLSSNATASAKKVDTGKTYDVTAVYDEKSGLVTGMIIKERK